MLKGRLARSTYSNITSCRLFGPVDREFVFIYIEFVAAAAEMQLQKTGHFEVPLFCAKAAPLRVSTLCVRIHDDNLVSPRATPLDGGACDFQGAFFQVANGF